MKNIRTLRDKAKRLRNTIEHIYWHSATIQVLEGLTDDDMNRVKELKKELKATLNEIQTILYA